MIKKFFGVAMLVLLVGLLLIAVAAALADDGDNLEKAAQAALRAREDVLIAKKSMIETMVPRMVADGVITADEMAVFKKAIDDFGQAKQTYDGELKVYGIATSTVLEKEYRAARDVYFNRGLHIRDDDGGTVRKFFASETGQDVVVKDDWGFAGDKAVALLIATIICLVLAGLFWWAGDDLCIVAFFLTLLFVMVAAALLAI